MQEKQFFLNTKLESYTSQAIAERVTSSHTTFSISIQKMKSWLQ